jgi:hypothetical protein
LIFSLEPIHLDAYSIFINDCCIFVGGAENEVEAMTKTEMFLLGGMVAWTPSVMFLALALWRAPLIDE